MQADPTWLINDHKGKDRTDEAELATL